MKLDKYLNLNMLTFWVKSYPCIARVSTSNNNNKSYWFNDGMAQSLQNKSHYHLLGILICMENDIVDRYSINYLLCKLIYLLGNKIVPRLDKRKKMNGLTLDWGCFFRCMLSYLWVVTFSMFSTFPETSSPSFLSFF